MVWLIRYAFLALALVCVVSLLSLVAPDAKASDRRRYLYVGSVVVVCAVVCILFQVLVPTEFKVVGEGNEVVETHSLASNGGREIAFFDVLLPLGSCISLNIQLYYMRKAKR